RAGGCGIREALLGCLQRVFGKPVVDALAKDVDGSAGRERADCVADMEEYFSRQTVPAPLAAYGHDLRRREEEAEMKLLTPKGLLPEPRVAARSRSRWRRP